MFSRLPGLCHTADERAQGGRALPRAAAQAAADPEEARLIERLRAGDEAAFAGLISMYYAAMLRVALMYVANRAAAEDVIQETWLGVLQGIGRFEGRSSLKTWIFRILANTAKTRARRDGRSVPFSALVAAEEDGVEPAVDPDRFRPADDPAFPHGWVSPPRNWEGEPEERLLSAEAHGLIARAIEALPPVQRAVITLRDVEGWTPEEVCAYLDITDGNQRVLLHRARGKVRRALERYINEE